MEPTHELMQKYELNERLIEFSISILERVDQLPRSYGSNYFSKLLIRCERVTRAFREFFFIQSKQHLVSKLVNETIQKMNNFKVQ